jgi:hypothetical protein
MVNAVGQQVWKGDMSSQLDVPVAGMARGMYYLQLTDTKTGEHTVKPVVLQ